MHAIRAPLAYQQTVTFPHSGVDRPKAPAPNHILHRVTFLCRLFLL